MSKYRDCWDEENAICPYCECKIHVELEDYSESEQEQQCDECGKLFFLKQDSIVSHHTKPDCEINGIEHEYEEIKITGDVILFCMICGKYSLPRKS